jgi:hypothetical protein
MAMRPIAPLALAGLLALAPSLARAEVTVSFPQPDKFTDASLNGPGRVGPDAPALTGLRQHLERLGQRLPPGQTLRVTVLDVDLAGRYEPWRIDNPSLRVMTDSTWPRLRLRYTLEQDGRVIAEAEETVSDLTYLTRARQARSGDRLFYEKAMLDDWFRQRMLRRG